MSYLKKIGTSFIYIALILAVITFVPGFPPYVGDFQDYNFVSPTVLKSKIARNNRLKGAEKLFVGEIYSPECFASFNGDLYTGLQGYGIAKITTDNRLIPIVRFHNESCEHIWQMNKCGKPLGMIFDKSGNMYVVDTFFGIFKIDVKTGKKVKIVDVNEIIDGKPVKLPNSVDIASNGDLYWTESSVDFSLDDGFYTFLANPSGRLIRYDAATKKNHVLLNNLGFANGIKLSKDEQFLIIAETMNARIIKYHLKGPKAGKNEIFIEGLPGLPDNLHSDGKNGFLVSLVVSADEEHPMISQTLAPHSNLRKMLFRLLGLVEAPFKCIQEFYPNLFTEKFINFWGSFSMMSSSYPDGTTICRINEKGEIVEVADTDDAKLGGISSAFVNNGFLWLGSPFNNYIARIPLKDAFPDLAAEESIDSGFLPNTRAEAPQVKNKQEPQATPKIGQKQQQQQTGGATATPKTTPTPSTASKMEKREAKEKKSN